MEKFEISPPVLNLSARSSCGSCGCNDQLAKVIAIPIVVLLALAGIGGIIYWICTMDPDFTERQGNYWVDSVLSSSMEHGIEICDHTNIVLRFNGSSFLHRSGDCIKIYDERHYEHDDETQSIPYYDRTFSCNVIGENITTINKYSGQRCRYDGDWKIGLSVNNRSSQFSGKLEGNSFKLTHIDIEFEKKADYSKRQKGMIYGFSMATGKAIANHLRRVFVNQYAHPDFSTHLRQQYKNEFGDDLEDTVLCSNYWPCPNPY